MGGKVDEAICDGIEANGSSSLGLSNKCDVPASLSVISKFNDVSVTECC